MNILIDARPLLDKHPTGVSRYARHLLDALFALESDHHYYVFINCAKDSVANRLAQWDNPQVHIVRTKIPSKLLHASIALFGRPYLDRLVAQKARVTIDLVVSLNSHFTRVSPQIPHVLTIHDLSIAINPRWYSRWQRLWHRAIGLHTQIARATMLISVSHNTKQDLMELYDITQEQIVVIPPGIPKPLEAADHVEHHDEQSSSQQQTILFLGTLEYRKNILNVIRSFAILKRKHPHAHLILAGNAGHGWQEAKRLIKSLGLEQSITRHPYVSEARKTQLLSHADVLLYPSFYEGFGLPVIEALHHGTPVVASVGSSFTQAGADAILSVNPWQPDMIAHALDLLLTNQELRTTLAIRATVHLKQFSWDFSAHKLLRLLDQYAHRH